MYIFKKFWLVVWPCHHNLFYSEVKRKDFLGSTQPTFLFTSHLYYKKVSFIPFSGIQYSYLAKCYEVFTKYLNINLLNMRANDRSSHITQTETCIRHDVPLSQTKCKCLFCVLDKFTKTTYTFHRPVCL